MINEIGNPIGFKLEKLLHESRKMKCELYPNSVFFFSVIKKSYGTCICRIDFIKKQYFIHKIIMLDFLTNSKLEVNDVKNCMIETVKEEYNNYELEMMDVFDIDIYETDFKRNKYAKIEY
jgi:hypothetical protein